MSLAERTRSRIRERPFLLTALRAGVLNHAAAARQLDIDGDPEAVATAIRRFGESLSPLEVMDREITVRMKRQPEDTASLLVVDGTALESEGTIVLATGAVDAALLARVIARLESAEIPVQAAGVSSSSLLVAVESTAGADTVRIIESVAQTAPQHISND